MPKVSVIIPIYNVEEYIEKALNSVCEQTLKDIEIICVDDCSTDKSKQIVEDFVAKDSRFRLISFDENKGQGVARNVGIQSAQGEYLMFLDPDDWYAKNTCEIAYNHINLNDSDISTFNNFRYYEKSGKLVLFNFCNVLRPIEGSCWKHIFRTEFIKNNNIEFGMGKNCEDNPFFLKSMILTDKISRINVPLYYYRRRKDNSSCRKHMSKSFDIIDMKQKCFEIIKDERNKAPQWSLNYCIKSSVVNFDLYYKKFKNKKLKKDFYNKTRNLFKLINNDAFFDKNLTEEVDIDEFKKIVKYNYYQYNTMKLVEKNITKLKESFF